MFELVFRCFSDIVTDIIRNLRQARKHFLSFTYKPSWHLTSRSGVLRDLSPHCVSDPSLTLTATLECRPVFPPLTMPQLPTHPCVIGRNLWPRSFDHITVDPPDLRIYLCPVIPPSFSQLTLQPTLLTRRGPPQPHSQAYTHHSSRLRSHPPPTEPRPLSRHLSSLLLCFSWPHQMKWLSSFKPFQLRASIVWGHFILPHTGDRYVSTGMFVQISRLVICGHQRIIFLGLSRLGGSGLVMDDA